jgi:hypothetical protein
MKISFMLQTLTRRESKRFWTGKERAYPKFVPLPFNLSLDVLFYRTLRLFLATLAAVFCLLKVGGARRDLNLPDYSGHGLRLSNMLLAWKKKQKNKQGFSPLLHVCFYLFVCLFILTTRSFPSKLNLVMRMFCRIKTVIPKLTVANRLQIQESHKWTDLFYLLRFGTVDQWYSTFLFAYLQI